jgi:hypothetical protein
MIDWHSSLLIQRVPVAQLKCGEALVRDPAKVMRFARLLIDQPRHDMDPILVKPVPGGYEIINGHHRFCAYIIAGRVEVLCLVIR